ncbi:CalY family protein [Blastococcus sp. PRF04-17]|uniref:CalY family protein n=1 Tax=Blastococcus sp. PRF04-17 TaxID=2933797 RepID=UPI001FF6E4C5|nr:CalY family protein [Blastococcus sp. PRF04-17]UOY03761.1 CalY family protein [Blastococcus sp. PRF04-17]
MNATRTSTRTSGSARKIVGSIGVLGAAVAVAGLGTFGSFTDSTTPISTQISSGTVSIDISQPGITIPVTTANFVPGDSISRAVDLINDGSVDLSRVSLASVAAAPGALTSDGTNGLQLSVRDCSVAWTQGGTAQSPTYTCGGSAATLYSGAAVMDSALAGVASLAAGGTDHLLLTVSLPGSAGNALMGQSSTLGLTFSGVQRDGAAR